MEIKCLKAAEYPSLHVQKKTSPAQRQTKSATQWQAILRVPISSRLKLHLEAGILNYSLEAGIAF